MHASGPLAQTTLNMGRHTSRFCTRAMGIEATAVAQHDFGGRSAHAHDLHFQFCCRMSRDAPFRVKFGHRIRRCLQISAVEAPAVWVWRASGIHFVGFPAASAAVARAATQARRPLQHCKVSSMRRLQLGMLDLASCCIPVWYALQHIIPPMGQAFACKHGLASVH